MGEKVTFNELTKIIEIIEAPDVNGEVFIDVKIDLYSDGKEDWVANENLRKFQFPIIAVGGNPLPGSKALGSTFFISSDWKIRPYNTSHRLIINGNLYSEDGEDPFLDTIGTYTVRIMQQVSSLVDSTVQQLAEIEYASFNGGVTVYADSPYSKSNLPSSGLILGTPRAPVNNLTDGLEILNTRGFSAFYIIGDIEVDNFGDYSGLSFVGESMTKSVININTDANVFKSEFYDCSLEGVLDGQAMAKGCIINDLFYINGIIEQCLLNGVITLGGGAVAHFLDCWCGSPSSIPIIDMGGSGQELSMRNYSGAVKIRNQNGNSSISITLIAGQVTIEDTITDGQIYICGVGVVDNQSDTDIDISDLLNPEVITSRVLDEPMSGHTIPGTLGGEIINQFLMTQRILGMSQENYSLDQCQYQTVNGMNLLISGRIRLYSDSVSVGTNNNILATYLIASTYDVDGNLSSYNVIKQ